MALGTAERRKHVPALGLSISSGVCRVPSVPSASGGLMAAHSKSAHHKALKEGTLNFRTSLTAGGR